MLELAPELLPLIDAGERVAVVTVTRVARSAPRGVGSAMAVTRDGRVIGSISGGCVEGDAVLLAHEVLRTGEGRTARFGFTDEQAHAAGLACGGSVEVVVGLLSPGDRAARSVLARAAADRPVTAAIALDGPARGRVVSLDDPTGRRDGALHPAAGRDGALDAAAGTPGAVHDDPAGGRDAALDAPSASPLATLPTDPRVTAVVATRTSRALDTPDGRVLLVSAAPRPRLIVLGAGEHAAALCRVGAASGFSVTVCDAWELLVTRERFPAADRLVAAFPHEYLRTLTDEDVDARTAICVLTHDERLDVPALRVALGMPVGFVGAMGARSTVARRAELLRRAGVAEGALARLHSPLGLDLGGDSPDETALSVLAEIVAARHGGTAAPLRDRTGPLHRRDAEAAAPGVPAEAPAAASCAVPAAP